MPALALGQGGSRQTAVLVFDQDRPGQTSGSRLEIDYVDYGNPESKPYAVQRVVIEYAPGTQIDTSVPARCEASNADLMSRGPTACPSASRVGGGEIDLDSGLPGPARILRYDVSLFNNRDELILLLESKSEPRSRIVARAVIKGATITTEVSPVPGGPPDGFTAIKRVRLSLDPVWTTEGDGRRSYLSTPPSCPAEGEWTSTITFTYRDGISQAVSAPSPCRPETAAADETPEAGVCLRPSSVAFKLNRARGNRVVHVAAYVNGSKALSRSGRDIRRVLLRDLPRDGSMRVRIVATHSSGSKVVSVRSWNGCEKSKPRVRLIRRR